MNRSMLWDKAVIGGPGVYLTLHFYPGYLQGLPVEVSNSYPGVLQRIHPQATKTTAGCIRSCRFCGTHLVEPDFQELDDWPDLPILTDNNLLATSQPHFDRVIDRLKKHGWADFNQGIDPRLLTEYHAERLSEIQAPIIRLSLDNETNQEPWENAFGLLRSAGIMKVFIRSYALIGFDTGVDDAWARCNWIEKHGIKALPMWYHSLNTFQHNTVTEEQKALGWNDYERRKIMQWFYQHKEAVNGTRTS
jgi:hypothetical protein